MGNRCVRMMIKLSKHKHNFTKEMPLYTACIDVRIYTVVFGFLKIYSIKAHQLSIFTPANIIRHFENPW